jgi:hypothetical protein
MFRSGHSFDGAAFQVRQLKGSATFLFSPPHIPSSKIHRSPMHVYGIDFTSAPSSSKPITCAQAVLSKGRLRIEALMRWLEFDDFDKFLCSDGPWITAMDFPFGLPKRLIQNLGWPPDWKKYVVKIADMEKEAFGNLLQRYQQTQPKGDKHHLRQTDSRACARSPMMWFGVPVGRMFFEGAPRLLNSQVSVIPCRPNLDSRVVLEGYPALAVRRWLGQVRYKTARSKEADRQARRERQQLLGRLSSLEAGSFYGFQFQIGTHLSQKLIEDPSGDSIDAVLCAVQAAAAFSRRTQNYGVPLDCDVEEGWIVDPALHDLR